MATKLKNIKYSKVVKAISLMLILASAFLFLSSTFFMFCNEYYISKKSYYDTNEYKIDMIELGTMAVELEVDLISEEHIDLMNKTSDDRYRKYSRLWKRKNELKKYPNFIYQIKNTKTDEIKTNLKEGEEFINLVDEKSLRIYKVNGEIIGRGWWYDYDIEEALKGKSHELQIGIKADMKERDAFYIGYEEYEDFKRKFEVHKLIIAISILTGLICIIHLIKTSGRKEKDGKIHLKKIDKLKIEVQIFLVMIAAIISGFISLEILREADSISRLSGSLFIWTPHLIAVQIIFVLDVIIGMTFMTSISRQFKNKTLLKNTIVYSVIQIISKIIGLTSFKWWNVVLIIGYFIFSIFTAVSMSSSGGFGFLTLLLTLVLVNAILIYFVLKFLTSLDEIVKYSSNLADGDLYNYLNVDKMPNSLKILASNIVNMQKGVKRAVEKEVKTEQMKISLIANVSHDLKTPLTSIITYVDLLKKQSIEDEKAKEYITVLDEKSMRMKTLIEDIIEVNKVSTGNVNLELREINLNELINQIIGEYQSNIEKANLNLHVNYEEKDVMILADGKSIWRVLENLIMNVVKYSAENTRVYIDVEEEEDRGKVTIKNISKEKLDISPEQLVERFVRGDEARTTEGSGLGLSIAESLTRIQDGDFKIDIDGDLFKVIVFMPKNKKSLSLEKAQ